VAHLSTGQIFREEMARSSTLGRRVRDYVTGGRLVPDALVVRVMVARLGASRRRPRVILDGFPRTRAQAAGLDQALQRRGQPLDGAVYLTSPLPLLARRLSGRRVCSVCGANYHVRTMRPARAGRCDRCGGPLITRRDDRPQTIRKRLAIDRRAAAPLLGYYRARGVLHTLDGRGRIETVFARAVRLFRAQHWLRA